MSCERSLNFDQWKNFFENYKPMRVWLWLVYKFTENYCRFGTFFRVHSNSKEVSYLSWQNTYPNLKTTCHIKLKFFLWTKLLENLLLAKYLISVAATLIKNVLFLRKSYYFKECAVSKKHFPDIEPCSNILVKGWYMFSFIWKKYQYFSVVLFLIDIILCLPSRNLVLK